ncbi:hypothetical protein [Gimesia sp.]|uniref:hypothetical protein n=1 Tax=Gimesia sp. TaxID=2024833 RepID=UPI000C42E224|nr:hypothetical protein [Gimesia sp.]MAX36244.1 hypothetical protein [Gimesia sp.]HAH44871.1 hypothetical protein [Planctomycetaceae bacterium]|tara:strand:+ start:16029 stop:16673 length:645 start_codon:yes stop_codon:yes gene_type:complete
MLTISKDVLPQTFLSYIAFRIAFMDTLERIALAKQVGDDPFDSFGFLTEVPFLRSVPPHVQLDLLSVTWAKHLASENVEGDLVDESVVYAVCESAARIIDEQPEEARRHLAGGPLDVHISVDHFLSSEIRNLHLNLSNEGDFLLISQFQDMSPDEALPMKEEFGIDEESLEPMFDVLMQWYMSVDFMPNLEGLLQEREVAKAITIVGLKQQPLC